MRWHPFRRAWANPIFQGGLASFRQENTRRSHGLNYLIILSAVLFITWPKDNFLSLRDLPFAYNALGGSVLMVLSYLSIHYGSRKTFIAEQLPLHEWLALAPLKAGEFLRGYVAAAGLDLMFFWALMLPLLVLAAGVSGESLPHLSAGLLVILICTSTYRMLGIAMLAWLERSEFVLYMLVRLCYVFFILVSGFLVPILNPILAFSGTSIWRQPVDPVQLYGVTLPAWVATVAIHLLLAGWFFIIALIRWRLAQRRAISSHHAQEIAS